MTDPEIKGTVDETSEVTGDVSEVEELEGEVDETSEATGDVED